MEHCLSSTELQGLEGTTGDNLLQPSPAAKASSQEQIAQESVQVSSANLQRRRLHNLSEQLIAGLCHPQSGIFQENDSMLTSISLKAAIWT